ncbi:MAG: GGDEF domain-containing protein [Piscirickettsiaceae bacterium]|nr:GGDEF domain-containing protein [Piscirickettsiaceae bacterium]
MEYSEYQDQAAEYMRMAIPLMKKHEIAMTPANYAVWYEYVSGNNTELNNAVDERIKSKKELTDQESRDLYQQFFDREKEQITIVELRQDLVRVFDEMLSYVHRSVDSSTHSNEHFSKVLARLNPDMTREQVHDVIEELVVETRVVMSSGMQLTEQLNIATTEMYELKKALNDSKRLAKTDRLTKLANRRSFDEVLAKMTRDSDNTGIDICLIFCDLDFFKNINDKHGHLVGDQVLKVIANTLTKSVKGRDLVSRYGGEEFTITLLNTTLENAKKLAEAIRIEIASKRIQRKDTREPLGQITMSFGVARYVPSEGVDSFLQRADRALYMSKKNGRNMISEAPMPIL